MKTLTVKKLIIPSVIAALVTGCGELQKTQSFLQAEEEYRAAANDPMVQKYASEQLSKADATLLSASTVETEEDMNSLAYIAKAEVETAVSKAEAAQAKQNSADLLSKKEQLIAEADKMKKEAAQQKLLEMETKEQERQIILAFGKIEFVTGTVNLVPGAAQGIDMLAAYLNKYKNKTVTLSGHTDSSGSAERNLELSQQRADYIRDVLISKGISPDRITAIGYGQTQPIASNSTSAGRQKNRRIDISFDQ